MSATHIRTTRRGSFDALRFQGILVTDSYPQLSSMLEKSLSRQHALLFAEPVHEASGEGTDWYSSLPGEARQLISLPAEDQQRMKKRIAVLAGDVDRLAKELMQDPGASKQIRGNILSLALRYPGIEHLYVIDGQPVITCWGFGPGTTGAVPEDLIRLGDAVPVTPGSHAAPNAVPAPARGGFGWLRGLFALLLGILAALALFFLLAMLFGPSGCVAPGMLPPGCASLSGGLLPGCAPPAPEATQTPLNLSEFTAEQEKERELRRQLEDLRSRLEARLAECPRVPPLAQAPAVTPPVQETPAEAKPPLKPEESALPTEEPKAEEQPEAPPSLEELMPTSPEPPPQPEPKNEPAPKAKPEEKPAQKPENKPLAKGEDMRIPEQARKNKDLSFLQGCWTSETGLMSTRGEPVQVQYCFDAKGQGTRTITETRNKTRCTGSVRTRFDASGRLVIDADGSPCNTGGGYVPQRVDCTAGNDGKAQCYGKSDNGRQWQARFRRQ